MTEFHRYHLHQHRGIKFIIKLLFRLKPRLTSGSTSTMANIVIIKHGGLSFYIGPPSFYQFCCVQIQLDIIVVPQKCSFMKNKYFISNAYFWERDSISTNPNAILNAFLNVKFSMLICTWEKFNLNFRCNIYTYM